mgnify:CR=1 FL=1
MNLNSIGRNIRKYRESKGLRQEDIANRTKLSNNYIGMIERGEKIPSLQTFINIVNAIGVSSDMILADVLNYGYVIKDSLLGEKLTKLSIEERNKIYDVIDTMLQHSTKKRI